MAAPVSEAEAEALAAVADAEPELEAEPPAVAEDPEPLDVEETVAELAAEVWARASAVALRVPHCSLAEQVDCP